MLLKITSDSTPRNFEKRKKDLEKYKKEMGARTKSQCTISTSVMYGLHFAGIWPGTPCPGVHKVFWVTFMLIFQIYQYKYVIGHLKIDTLLETIDNLSIAMPFSLVCIKLIVAWTNHGVLTEILSTMKEDCRKYAVIDKNNFIPKTAQLSYRLTSLIMSVYVSSVVFYAAGAFASKPSNDSMPRELLLKMDLPFETGDSPIYELVVTTQFLHQMTSAFTFGVFSAMLLMMTLHVGCQIDIICRTLKDPSGKRNQLRFFISRHQEIIHFTGRIEKLFTYIALSQLVSNTLITCCLGFLIMVSLNAENGLPILIKSIMFYLSICLEAFIYCFAGEYLNTKSKMIGDAAYDSLWYDLYPSENRLLVILILRSQKGLTLTFGKFSKLSLESFTGKRIVSSFAYQNTNKIMKASASYMSVLLAMS